MKQVLSLLTDEERMEFGGQLQETVARLTDEKWDCRSFQDLNGVKKYIAQEPVLDVVNWDVTLDQELNGIIGIRRRYKSAFLMILADSSMSPMQYIRPGISPNSLLLKPYTQIELERAVNEMVLNCTGDVSDEDTLLIHTRECDRWVPFSQIYYVEAREKKLFIRTKAEEFGFYNSIEGVKKTLPEYFRQCHRSYIVNMKRVIRVELSKQVVEMDGGICVPIARSYKKSMRGQ